MGEQKIASLQVAVELNIRIYSDGRLTMKGPLNDKILCWGVLEAAREFVTTYRAQQVVVPEIVVPGTNPS
jgi:hypothetical protein